MGLFAERLRPAVDGGSLEQGIATAAPFTGVLAVRLEPNEPAHRLKPYRENPVNGVQQKHHCALRPRRQTAGLRRSAKSPVNGAQKHFSRHQDHAGHMESGVSLKKPTPFDTLPVSAPPRAFLGRIPRQTQGEMSVPGR